MIVYDLSCPDAHSFEGWFSSSGDFETQRESGLLVCPVCESSDIRKAPMAPAVATRRSNQSPAIRRDRQTVVPSEMPPQMREAFAKLAKAQAKALEKSTWVGGNFAEEVRSQHYGEKDEAPVHGKASIEDAKALVEEGIGIAPILFPIAEPDKLN